MTIPEDEIEDEGYVPEPIGLCDGEVILFDPAEFESAFNAYGVMASNGCLFYLCKDARKWVNVEDFGRPAKASVRKVQ